MKNFLWIAILTITISSCEKVKDKKETTENQTTTIFQKEFSEGVASVFKAHGGIDGWNAMPFVLGDDGITYSEIDPLTFEGCILPQKYHL